ncbi:sensor histidine kinase [Sorangium sp. So ce1151]|uniref:sensor histidine kinase n=1 Tax=Sorangium sp. So ce1151 TaxID=3133332 RepID=UPI003F63AB20
MVSPRVSRRRYPRASFLAALAIAVTPVQPAGAASPQPIPSIRTFTLEDGLPQSTILTIALEPRGRLWVGTQLGAAFYDGQRFTPFPLPISGATSWVDTIAVTHDGAVWFGLHSGELVRYAAEKFTHFGAAEGFDGAQGIRAIFEASAGGGHALWAATAVGLFRLVGERWSRVELGPGLERVSVNALAEGALPSGAPTLWVGTSLGLLHCEEGRCAPFASKAGGLPDERISALLSSTGEGGRKELWVGTVLGLSRLAEGRWEHFTTSSSPLSNGYVWTLAETVSGSGRRTLWIGTFGGGLARLTDGVWTVMSKASSGLPDDYITALAPSKGEHGGRTLWIGTRTSGLARLRHDGFGGFTPRNSPFSGAVAGITEVSPQGAAPEIWFSMDSGVIRLSEQGFSPLTAPGMKENFGNAVSVLFSPKRHPGVVWIGSDSAGLHRWENGQVRTYDRRDAALLGSTPLDLRESIDRRALLVASVIGAARLDEQGTWQVFTRQSTPLLDDQVAAVVETARPSGGVTTWFGTLKGLSRLEDGQWQSYTPANSPLGAEFVLELAEIRDAHGARVLWIGTDSGGAARYDLDAGKWRGTLNSKSRPALPDNGVTGIVADARGRVYLSTSRGVSRLTPRAPTPEDPAEFSVYTFTTEDGLPSNELALHGVFLDSRGRLWAATTGGPAVLDPAEEVEDSTPKPLVFSSSRAAGGALPLSPAATLAWNQSTVSFAYGLLSFYRERDTRYRVQMVGFDPAPSDWTVDTKATYTNLPEGSYTFQVWGRDYAGNVAGPMSMAFQVKPAPWRTWWAYLGYTLALLGLVYGGVRARLSALRRQNRTLELLVEQRTAELTIAKDAADSANRAKTTFLANMSHELHAPLSAILGHAELLQRSPDLAPQRRSSIDVVRRSGEHLLVLIDDLLDLARIEAGRMDLAPSNVHLPSLVRGVVEMCRVRAQRKGFALNYAQEGNVPAWVSVDEKRLMQVLINLLGNAVKFTSAGRVIFRVEATDDSPEGRTVLFHVEDTGPGIAPADLERIFVAFEQAGDHGARRMGAGLGLAISRRIVEQMGGKIEVKSALGEGSTFTVTLRLRVVGEESLPRRSTPPPSEPVAVPSPEVRARLSELAERGRLQELSQELVKLEAEDPALGPWLREARTLAEEFRVHELRALLAVPET